MAKDRNISGTAGFSVSAPEPTVVVDTQRRMYHVGTLPGCSHHNVTVGGICFPEETEVVTLNDKTKQTDRSRRQGDIVPMTPDQVERVRKAISERVIRWRNSHEDLEGNKIPRSGFIRVTSDKRYVPGPTDEPLGNYLYMDELEPGAFQMGDVGKPVTR